MKEELLLVETGSKEPLIPFANGLMVDENGDVQSVEDDDMHSFAICEDRPLIQDLWLILGQMRLVADMLDVPVQSSYAMDIGGNHHDKIIRKLGISISSLWVLMKQAALQDHQEKWIDQIADHFYEAFCQHAVRMEQKCCKPFGMVLSYSLYRHLCVRHNDFETMIKNSELI